MSGLKFSGISKASCAEVLKFNTEIDSVMNYEIGHNLVIMNGPRRTACFAKGMHSYTLFTLK